MRVAIDTRSLRPPLTGIGHFVHRLSNAMLPLLSPDEELLAFSGWTIKPLDHAFLVRIEESNFAAIPGDSKLSARRATDSAHRFLRQLEPARRLVRTLHAHSFRDAQKNFDLFHAVNYLPPGSPHRPVLPVIYDVSHIRFPETHPRERIEWLERGDKLLADAPFVQTVSKFSKSEIVALLGISAARIYVTYPAPGEYFRPEGEADGLCLKKYDVEPHKYLLVVGTREPRKNFRTVAEAYTVLPTALQAQYPLLWVGPSGWGDLSLSSAIARATKLGQIRIIGYVPDRDLAALYRNTTLFLMPSPYEGFGMPVIEALACRARVALSKIPVFEEIAGRYARYVDPMDVEGWRQAISDAIDEGPQWPGRGSLPDLARFSWHSSAATTLDLYRRLFSI